MKIQEIQEIINTHFPKKEGNKTRRNNKMAKEKMDNGGKTTPAKGVKTAGGKGKRKGNGGKKGC
jgi:hypothetical protein